MADDYYGIGGDFAPSNWWENEVSFANMFPATDYYGLGNDFATPADLINSGYLGSIFSGTPDSSLNFNFSPDSYTYATPEELLESGYNAPNSGIAYATPKELADSGYTGIFSGLGPTGSYAPGSTDPKPTGGGSSGGGSSGGSTVNKVVDAVKQLVGGATKAVSDKAVSAGGIADLATLIAKIYATANPSFADPKSVSGYQGGVPKYTASRQQLARAPYKAYSGSSEPVMGRQSFTPMKYAAEGGIMELARGGRAKQPRYLDGATDGMADKIDTDIDGKQRAKLSHGEFVIPADVVSHLGNGNSKAGADALYKMMSRVRKARTGNPKQGKQINPDKFTPGGIAGYAGGGAVAFAGPTGSVVPPASSTMDAPEGTSTSSSLSNWAGPTVTNMIGRAEALSNTPYEAYTGPISAGTSPVQSQAFTAAAGLPGALGPVGSVQSYMNPYMQGVVDVQNTEARRQADISRVADAGRLTQAGAFGGSRQAIMESEGNRNLATLQNANQLTGLNTAYNNAVNQQKNVADYGLQAATTAANIGGQQRAIEQQGIDASRGQFEEERADPYKKLQFLQTMFSGMPVATNTTTANASSAGNLQDLLGLVKALFP